MPFWLEHFAVAVCAISGVLAAAGRRVDLFGVLVLAVVTMLRMEVAVPPAAGVTGVTLGVHVAFAGQPDTVKPTALLKLFNDVTVSVEVPDAPCVIESDDDGLADSEKLGVADV